jgi:hypothetical protein
MMFRDRELTMPRPSAVAIALGVLCLGALGIATNIATSALPPAWSHYLWLAWPAMPVLLGAAAVIEVRRSQVGSDDGGADSPRARVVLLDRVHRYWVRGVLEKSLYQEARIELGMTVTVDAPHPWDVVVASPDGSSRVVAPGTTMAEVFDELDKTILVLGAPGSGKTTMMLELVRELLQRAITDSQHPIPVVLTLSSWTLPREPLGDWIVRELAVRYEIPTAQARTWLNTDQLIPLLDGLDEVAEKQQPACVMAINNFRAQRGTTRIVVCCRTTDYERLREPLRTYGTLTIQPLSKKQIEDFLTRAGELVAAVRAAIAADSSLGELIQSPLLLSIAVLAYRDAPVATVATGGDSRHLRDQLFATYVRTMLARRRSDRHSARQTVRWLAFLADRMQRESQTVFTLELLDKYAVLFWTSRFVPPTRRSSLICGLVGGLVLGAAGMIAYGWRGGLVGAAVGLLHVERIDTRNLSYHRRTRGQGREAWNPEVRIGRIRGWFFNFRLAAGDPAYLDDLPVTAGVAATVGVLFGSSDGLVSGLTYGIATAVGVLTAVILCIGYGYTIRDMQSVAPREGSGEVPSLIARAVMRRGLLAAPLVALVTSLLPGLLVAWPGTSADGYRFAAVVAVGAGMLTLVWLGGFAVVEQAMVRFTLRKLDLAPLPLRPFLDYATQCLFLRQVGDGYLFVHLSLLEFFAGMWDLDDVSAERLDELAPQ